MEDETFQEESRAIKTQRSRQEIRLDLNAIFFYPVENVKRVFA